MRTIKSYTDILQSKKLAEILPTESADMYYACGARVPDIMIGSKQDYRCYTVCWSLAALLSIMPTFTIDSSDDHHFRMQCCHHFSQWHNSLIDACYEMVLKLHELKML